MKRTFILIGAVVLAAASQAQTMSNAVTAFGNATVKPAGVRTGASGQNFFNVEGNSNGTNASYGVADFNGASVVAPSGAGSINGLVVSLTESNAAFTAPGGLNFWLTTDTSTNIVVYPTGTSPLVYDSTTATGVQAGQLATLISLGSGTFSTTGNVNSGTVDTYTFSGLSSTAVSLLSAATSSTPRTVRLVITPDNANTPGVSATFAGFSNTTYTGPQIALQYGQAVPEPASLLAGLLVIPALIKKRRR